MTQKQDAVRARLALLIPINNLPPKHQNEILRSTELLEFRKKEYVFLQGDEDHYSFYILDGVVELYADDQLIKTVEGGEASSFHALAQLRPRQMSARAKSRLTVLRIDRSLLDKLLSLDKDEDLPGDSAEIEVSEIAASESADWLTTILQSPLFARIPPSNIQRMLETLESVEFKAGDVVIRQGDPGDYYYSIQDGRCAVTRLTNNKKQLKLAELHPGDTFGEEALVSNAKRNASVTMITDGKLARLTKDKFLDLITKPILDTLSFEDAEASVNAGATWLDVRFPEEHEANGLEGSVNIPISFLRTRYHELSPGTSYVAYCDTGGRSSAAAFLLAQRGFDVCYVEGGAIKEAPEKPANKTPSPTGELWPKKTPELPEAIHERPSDPVVEANSRALSLSADLEKAKLQIAQAQRLMEEADIARRNVDRIVQEKLETERDKLTQDAERVKANLAGAERLKNEIEAQQKSAAKEAQSRYREQEERLLARQREAEEKLQQEERRLEEVYRKQTEQLERLQASQIDAREELAEAWKNLEVESTQSRERLEAAKQLEDEIREKEQHRRDQIKQAENHLREEMQKELALERHRLEAQFAKTAEEFEQARCERLAAHNAKRGAEEEAKRIIEEYKQEQQEIIAKHEAQLAIDRKRLEQEAERLRAQLEQATRAKDQAEFAKREADKALEIGRDKQSTADATEAGLRTQITSMEQRAETATRELRAAIATEMTVENSQRENEKRLERTCNSKTEINMLMQKELEEWVAEQERIQTSTAQRNELQKQRMQVDRIKTRALQARTDREKRDKTLLDEIAEQLGG